MEKQNIKIQIFSPYDYSHSDVIYSVTKSRLTDNNHLEFTDNLSWRVVMARKYTNSARNLTILLGRTFSWEVHVQDGTYMFRLLHKQSSNNGYEYTTASAEI